MGYKIYLYTLLFAILQASHVWFVLAWHPALQIGISILNLLAFNNINKSNQLPKGALIIIFVLMTSPFWGWRVPKHWVLPIFTYIPFITLLLLKDDVKMRIARSVYSFFSVTLFLSLVLYFWHGFGLPLLEFPVHRSVGIPYDYPNYFLYIQLKYSGALAGAFSGYCIEPGYLSLLCVCLLFIAKFDLKDKRTYIFITAIIFSMSLGGYILMVAGYLMVYFMRRKKNMTKTLFGGAVILLILYALFVYISQLDNGNNVIAEEILSRLAFDSDKGIAGNNRENAIAEIIIDNFFYSDSIWFGIGEEKWVKDAYLQEGFDACSWRIFVVKYGAVYTVLAISLILLYCKKISNPDVYIPLLTIYFLDFIQHATLFSESFIFLLLLVSLYKKQTYDSISFIRSKKSKLCLNNKIV